MKHAAIASTLILFVGCGEVTDSATVDASAGADAKSAANTAPTITSGDLEAEADQLFQVSLAANDAENDNLTWESTGGLPVGAVLSSDGVLTWTPTVANLGRYEVAVTVTDDGTPAMSDQKTIGIEVRGAHVRVLVSNMAGTEPATITSTDQPSLFKLSPFIESATLTAVNPAAPSKDADGTGTWRAAVTPISATNNVAGYLELTIVPMPGAAIELNELVYTTSAKFANNPSSFQLMTSDDGFANALSVIGLDAEKTEHLAITHPASGDRFIIRWVAGNDFGENGGGQAGFSTNDVEIRR